MAIDFAKLQENAKKVEASGSKKTEQKEKDTRYYEAQRDKKTGNFSSIIRFLHSDDVNEMPFVKRINHKNEEGTYNLYSQCPTEIGEKCPICEYNRLHWNEYSVNQQGRKRKTRFVTNILVVSDPKFPDREGKVFLFSYGIKVHEKIMKKISPDLEKNPKAKAVNIFDYVKGRNFLLNIKTVDKYPNYDDCEWEEESSEIDNMDAKILSLAEFMPKKEEFKTYEEINTRFEKFLKLFDKRDDRNSAPERTPVNDVSNGKQDDLWPAEATTPPTPPTPKTSTSKVSAKVAPTTEKDFFDFDAPDGDDKD